MRELIGGEVVTSVGAIVMYCRTEYEMGNAIRKARACFVRALFGMCSDKWVRISKTDALRLAVGGHDAFPDGEHLAYLDEAMDLWIGLSPVVDPTKGPPWPTPC
jgi:hypothetical protein